MFERHVLQDLSAYHHGQTSGEERTRIETHLQGCSRCRTSYEKIQLGARLASTLQVSQAPDSIWQELSSVQARPVRRRWGAGVAVAACGVSALIAVFIAVRSRTSN